MFIWTAIDVNGELLSLREKAEIATRHFGYQNPALTLPLHISTRISFFASDDVYIDVVRHINDIYHHLSPFFVETGKIEKSDNIVWLRIEENDHLKKIHDELIVSLKKRFEIGTHVFDERFIYHTTLFFGKNAKEAENIHEMLKNENFPKKLGAMRFLTGISESGKAGEFRIFDEIEV